MKVNLKMKIIKFALKLIFELAPLDKIFDKNIYRESDTRITKLTFLNIFFAIFFYFTL